MNIIRDLKQLLLILLLTLSVSGVVSAKSVSGGQNLDTGLHQGETVFKLLLHQGKNQSSYDGVSGYTVSPKGGDNTGGTSNTDGVTTTTQAPTPANQVKYPQSLILNPESGKTIPPATPESVAKTTDTTIKYPQKNTLPKGALENASQNAFKAADNVASWTPKNKHILTGGSQSKARFNTDNIDEIRDIVQSVLNSPDAKFLPNPNLPGSFRVIGNAGKPIGIKGQQNVRIIVGSDGKVINAFPVHSQ